MGFSLAVVHGFLVVVASLVWSMGSGCTSFSSCGSQVQQLWHMGLAALGHMGSSQIRDQTRVSCNNRQILYH